MGRDEEDVSTEVKGKFKTSISLNYYLKERLEEEIERGTFVSNSDAIGTALAKMFGHLDERRELKKSKKISDTVKSFEAILQTEEGRKVIEAALQKRRDCEEKKEVIKKPEDQPGKKSQVLFGGDPEDYSPTTILD